jgi:fatty acid/phospholipid biosynthesis enzyme
MALAETRLHLATSGVAEAQADSLVSMGSAGGKWWTMRCAFDEIPGLYYEVNVVR